ncbi:MULTISPECIES: YqaA family protein [unclassified Rhizobium]|jgi:membrane protein YqaA with SNARE-associated domain|uniref:YqaA family protein n=1 Tax=unclassified Rhizobium TaxID=2613769 RepID=UPI00160E98AF|nr:MULTISPECIES: YqaA family protein [unclassified Rhizobium]MBB3540027.1 membrane protein YqaA with SNARE-associated domain [Rhizobium sp. BK399]MCS3738963.1 membrane protein YqaA with SNARE-associated domain [Rhizobium sp. BK661]MCS4090712.1 membrane protein YqaA with SNARE-associated domain [Rhizobium sp. BK176]
MTDLAVYTGLFLMAFAAATIFPMQSEAGLIALILANQHPVFALILVATIGNVLGSTINWLLGLGIERFRDKRWFPIRQPALDKAQRWYRRYGKWSLLLSWVPVIGDPITIVAGVLREPFPMFLLLVTIAKTTRYAVLAAVTLGIAN